MGSLGCSLLGRTQPVRAGGVSRVQGTGWHGPLTTGVWMELCTACNAHRSAARAFIRWYRDTDRGPKALPRPFEDRETETMHVHGWARSPQLAPPESPAPPPDLTPRGRG
jgi:hypothetical protein